MTPETSRVADATRSVLHRYVSEVRSFFRSRSAPPRQLRATPVAPRQRISVELDELQAERRLLPAQFGLFAELQQLLAAVPPADRLLLEQRLLLSCNRT